ncbi:MAG: hypothetical protein L0226_12960 [Acidobacteria bacterium]|nr:hypothetical protein [Acidobacteriota bacterium]
MISNMERKRENETGENSETSEMLRTFRLFRYFRLFRFLSSVFPILIILMIALPVGAQTSKPNDRITIHELKRKMDRKEDIVIIDTRAGNSYIGSTVKIKGAIHITLDELPSRLSELPKKKEIITYCT